MTKPKSCLRGCLLYGCLPLLGIALVSAVPFWYFCLYAPPLVISEATTYITEPLTADGQVDYFKALEARIHPPEMQTDDNGFRDVVRLFGYVRNDSLKDIGLWSDLMSPEDIEFYRRLVCEKLNLDPDVLPTLVMPAEPLKIFLEFYEKQGGAVPTHVVFSRSCCGNTSHTVLEDSWIRPWTLEQFPMFADWLKEIDEPMDAIATAIRKPIFVPPLLQDRKTIESNCMQQSVHTISIMPANHLSYSAGHILQARGMYRIANGDIDGAIDDKLTLYRLGRLIGQKGFPYQYIIGNAIETKAATIPISADSTLPPTKEQIQRLIAGLDTLPQRRLLADVYEVGRFSTLSYLQAFMRGLNSDENLKHIYTYITPLPDWNAVFRRVNEIYDAMQEPPPREKYNAIQEMQYEKVFARGFYARMLTSYGRGTNLVNMYFDVLTVAEERVDWWSQRAECAENMQRLALAMLLYQHEHGKLPDENWATQIVPYLGENPEQYFSCPTNPSPKGVTTYALVQYEGAPPAGTDTVLLVELKYPVPLDKAVCTVDDVLKFTLPDTGRKYGPWRWQDEPHNGGMNLAYRTGAIRFLRAYPSKQCQKELLRSLGRAVEAENDATKGLTEE